MDAELLFVNVSDLLPLTLPTVTGPQLKLDGFATSAPTLAIPVPDSATVRGLLLVELEMAKAAEREPVLGFLKRIVNVQVAAADRFEPHEEPDTANSFAWAPVTETPASTIALAVPFFKVTVDDLPSEPA